MSDGRPHVMLVGSAGGHLAQLIRLAPWWETCTRTWVTFDKPDARSLLADEDVVWAFHPTTRNVPNLLRNGVLRDLLAQRPRLKHLLVHNVDTLGADLDPGLLGLHLASGRPLTYEVIGRRIDDRGGGLARVDGRVRILEGLAMPREQRATTRQPSRIIAMPSAGTCPSLRMRATPSERSKTWRARPWRKVSSSVRSRQSAPSKQAAQASAGSINRTPTRDSGMPHSTRRSQVSLMNRSTCGAERPPSANQSITL